MSGPSLGDRYEAGSAEAVDARAAQWLAQRHFYNWSDEDQAALNAWLGEARGHAAAYWRLKAAWDRTERLVALRLPEPDKELVPALRRRWLVVGGVVVVCLLGILWGAATFLFAPASQVYTTNVGGHTTIALADGSQVELNTNTVVRASLNARQRTVEVEKGEAYFQVVHDAKRPFVVVAANHRIVDLGTKFLVRYNPTDLEVVLVEGRARLENEGSAWLKKRAAVLTRGDVAVATANSLSIVRKADETVQSELAWRQGTLVFKHVTLGEAASEFNRYNSTQLVVTPDVASVKIDGTFATGSVGPFARMAEFALGLHVQDENSQIVISR